MDAVDEKILLSKESAGFLLDLLGRQQLSAGDPNLMQTAALVARARMELLGEQGSSGPGLSAVGRAEG